MKTKNLVIVLEFLLIIFSVFMINIIKKDETMSSTERRKLAQLPKFTTENIWSDNLSDEFEKYSMDQFFERDSFRKLKYYFSTYIARQKDVNKLFVLDNNIYKIEYPMSDVNIKKSANKIQNIINRYLNTNNNVYYSIIPDKNYYLDDSYLKMDYSEIEKLMAKNINGAKYIDIFDCLTIEDYYRTDLHWKQENLGKIVEKLEKEMKLVSSKNIEYTKEEVGNFYGAYYGQTGANISPDKIVCLENDTILNSTTYNMETKKTGKVYDMEKYTRSYDKYDVYLSGATTIITIDNPNSESDKELLLFRDSFGSSLAPLLLNNYRKITLIDTRYIDSTLLEQFIEFKDQDVLFMYSGMVLNQDIIR